MYIKFDTQYVLYVKLPDKMDIKKIDNRTTDKEKWSTAASKLIMNLRHCTRDLQGP